jgi:hypothetical protein
VIQGFHIKVQEERKSKYRTTTQQAALYSHSTRRRSSCSGADTGLLEGAKQR